MLLLEGVSTAYDGVPMLRDVDLVVKPGELVCLLGPNGAGKTTMFRTITGLVRPTAGRVSIAGRMINRMPVNQISQLRVGVVPEGRRLFAKLTVVENLRLGYRAAHGTSSFPEMLSQMTALFPRVGERLAQLAGTLSGGEQAMVALARALIGSPKYLIMDEPSLGLSPRLVEEYFDLVYALKGRDHAILLIEQNAEMSLEIADRAYMLLKGQLTHSGSASDLRSSGLTAAAYLDT